MKGFLHRLAARAAGTSVAVRSDARLPFAGSRLWTGLAAEEPPGHTADIAGWNVTPPSHPTISVAPLVQGLGSEPPTPATGPVSSPPSPTPLLDGTAGNLARPTVDDPVAATSVKHAAASDTPGCDSKTTLKPALAETRIAATGITEPRLSERQIREHRPLEHAPLGDQLPEAPKAHDPSVRPQREPPALLASQPERALLSGTNTPKSTGLPLTRLQVPATEEAHEVHVHIGRIEVTAAHERSPPPRRTARKDPPMSLDAYLAKRSRP